MAMTAKETQSDTDENNKTLHKVEFESIIVDVPDGEDVCEYITRFINDHRAAGYETPGIKSITENE